MSYIQAAPQTSSVAFVDVPFAADLYLANGTVSWTLLEAGHDIYRYAITQNLMILQVDITQDIVTTEGGFAALKIPVLTFDQIADFDIEVRGRVYFNAMLDTEIGTYLQIGQINDSIQGDQPAILIYGQPDSGGTLRIVATIIFKFTE